MTAQLASQLARYLTQSTEGGGGDGSRTSTVEFPACSAHLHRHQHQTCPQLGRPNIPAPPTPMTKRRQERDTPGHHRTGGAVCGRPLQPPGCYASLTRPPAAALDPEVFADPAAATDDRTPEETNADR